MPDHISKTMTSRILPLLFMATLMPLVPGTAAQKLPAESGNAKAQEIDVPAAKQWVDTNIDLRAGAKLRFTASGTIKYPADPSYAGKLRTSGSSGPDGLPRVSADLVHQYPVKDAGHGALVGRVGSEDASQPFLIGATRECSLPVAG